jgi:hypothetical protein
LAGCNSDAPGSLTSEDQEVILGIAAPSILKAGSFDNLEVELLGIEISSENNQLQRSSSGNEAAPFCGHECHELIVL